MAKNPLTRGYPEQKSEDYQLLGGINTKVSLYMNGPAEFRDISNLNFINTGALTKRPGSTLFGGQTLIGATFPQVTSGYEFQQLEGPSYLVVSQNGKLWQALSATFLPPVYFVNPQLNVLPSQPTGTPGSLFSFVSFVDRLFACNGSEFYRLSLVTGNQFGYSTQINGYLYSTPAGTSFGTAGVTTGVASGLSGVYVVGWSFINDRGYIGPPSNGITLTVLNNSSSIVYNFTNQKYLTTYYGVTAIQLYRSEIDGVVLTGTTLVATSSLLDTASARDIGFTLTDTAFISPNTFYLPGNGVTFPVGNTSPPFIPRYLEVFNNQLIMAGFSTAPSTFWWSDIGEPEGIEPQNSDEVRSNDGDVISGLKSYLGSLMITKRRSVHLLSGDNPDNFLLQELSDQYGCVSHKSIVTWNNVVWFLDSKGVMEYNGANLECVSNQIEPIFNAMNLSAAYDNACGLHVKKFNEIWFSIPANGSTINNQIIVYDYVAKAWTHYDGIQAQCLFNARAGFPNAMPFAGNYTGGLVYFDSTLTSDNDRGITCSFDSIFFSARGQTTENMYRRFYLNVEPVFGFTQPITMTFKTNFGSSVQLTRTMYQAPYQSRIDFGLSARSIQASMYHYAASLSLKINGFAVESRFQRGV